MQGLAVRGQASQGLEEDSELPGTGKGFIPSKRLAAVHRTQDAASCPFTSCWSRQTLLTGGDRKWVEMGGHSSRSASNFLPIPCQDGCQGPLGQGVLLPSEPGETAGCQEPVEDGAAVNQPRLRSPPSQTGGCSGWGSHRTGDTGGWHHPSAVQFHPEGARRVPPAGAPTQQPWKGQGSRGKPVYRPSGARAHTRGFA